MDLLWLSQFSSNYMTHNMKYLLHPHIDIVVMADYSSKHSPLDPIKLRHPNKFVFNTFLYSVKSSVGKKAGCPVVTNLKTIPCHTGSTLVTISGPILCDS